MERIGIYGGAFNPPHLGHIRGAEYALKALGLDKILMIPSCVSPHKDTPPNSPEPEMRLKMLQLALEDEKNIEASDLELVRGGVSYTCETLNQVKKMHPGAELFLLMGTDMFLGFESWKNADQIAAECTLAVFYRGQKEEKTEILENSAQLQKLGANVRLVENPVTEISSTQLRRLLVFRSAAPYLPEKALKFIEENGLYGTGRDYRNLPIDKLEQVVVSLLKPNRVKHVLGVRQTAEKLAKLYGADPVDAARAGLLHDVTKALDGPLQLTLCHEYGKVLDKFSCQNPKTLHDLTGSLVAEKIFGENHEVVEAIRSHTTGKPNMNLLQKNTYVADYMEPNRDFPGVEKLRKLAFENIDEALMLGLRMTLKMLKEQGKEISPESREALSYMEQSQKG